MKIQAFTIAAIELFKNRLSLNNLSVVLVKDGYVFDKSLKSITYNDKEHFILLNKHQIEGVSIDNNGVISAYSKSLVGTEFERINSANVVGFILARYYPANRATEKFVPLVYISEIEGLPADLKANPYRLFFNE